MAFCVAMEKEEGRRGGGGMGNKKGACVRMG